MWIPRGLALYVAGLAHHRAGRPEPALKRLREALNTDPGWPGRALNHPALALALHAAGKPTEAREALDRAEKVQGQWLEALQGPVASLPVVWVDWVEFLCLYREAHLLLTGSAPPDDPRLRKARQRALAAINQH
jgi:tetratricopeptide (TPR) repeat protein